MVPNVLAGLLGSERNGGIHTSCERIHVELVVADRSFVADEHPNLNSHHATRTRSTMHVLCISELQEILANVASFNRSDRRRCWDLCWSSRSRTDRQTCVSLQRIVNVDYTIGVAVFGVDGTMLGTSTVVCHVPRIWLGVYAQQPVDLTLDFGISNCYPPASKFHASISDCTVLTPDQWLKG